MNRDEIIEKLRAKKGYLKKGVEWLANKLGHKILNYLENVKKR